MKAVPVQRPANHPASVPEKGRIEPAPPIRAPQRIGFLAGWIAVPDDFDRMGEVEIPALFEGEDES